jgi:hypothetical protein
MLFFNIRVFALSQTYIGYKIIERAYSQVVDDCKNKSIKLSGDYHGKYYNLLRDKLIKSI